MSDRYAKLARAHADTSIDAAADAAAEVIALRFPATARAANHRALSRHLAAAFRASVRELADRTTAGLER